MKASLHTYNNYYFRPNRLKGFTLLEILTVIGIMIIMISIGFSIFRGNSQNVENAANSLLDVLQQARTAAMTDNNYVYVGLSETDGNSPEILVAVMESVSGLASSSNSLVSNIADPEIRLARAIKTIKGVQIDTTTADNNMPGNPLTSLYGTVERLDDPSRTDPITFPASVATRRSDVLDDIFDYVIQFSPDGAARLDATTSTVPNYIVFGMVPTSESAANSFGVIIDGPSGASRILRAGG